MTYTKLHAETGRESRDMLRSVLAEIRAEVLRRHPGDYDAQYKAGDLPLRMTIQLDVDTDQVPARNLSAETVRGAKDILDSALEHLNAQRLRRNPGDPDAQHRSNDEPLKTWIHFDLDDLDRQGPLSVEECLHLPYDGIPKGLRPSANHRPGRTITRSVPAGQRKRTVLQRVLGL
ncbi:hypothetical protein [Streptomyces sp. H27-C3]|uniref:hypothetical protein n=1 Tax=Streptomyces sp. H27-C3 TaxID=3046305 RepID=UPI0024BB52B4|nr:hypothetical protein [Streptomyces sp. H27-C3]MDJ0465030.1 hypothetical protein [Streptomyces sp. H27-C3]